MSLARIQAGSTANPTTMGASLTAAALTTQNLTDIATQLALLAAPVLDGPGLYAANCAGCHNPLATSTKGGATAAKIQQEITNNRAGVMGAANLVALTPTQIGLIATSLAAITPPACGSCHAVSLASVTGSGHNTHNSKPGAAILTLFKSTNGCGVCHGAGYSTTSNSSLLTHNDGIRTVATNTTGVATATANATLDKPIVWVPPVRSTTGTITTKGTCSPACHNPAGAKRSW